MPHDLAQGEQCHKCGERSEISFGEGRLTKHRNAMKPDETKTDQPTPEQLLKMLDQQIADQRKRKKSTPTRRALLLMVGFVIIFGGLVAALLLFQYMMQELPRRP